MNIHVHLKCLPSPERNINKFIHLWPLSLASFTWYAVEKYVYRRLIIACIGSLLLLIDVLAYPHLFKIVEHFLLGGQLLEHSLNIFAYRQISVAIILISLE